ncbi:leucine-rich repeat domain-containing protein [Clostridiaceae bacterium M8S5]|nr:leucine-rich repeat domain-containing protein [Clostridiaceae bacterium M8S5]
MKRKLTLFIVVIMFIIGIKTQVNAQQVTWTIYKDEKIVEIKNQPFSEGDEIFFPLEDMIKIKGFKSEFDKYNNLIIKNEDLTVLYCFKNDDLFDIFDIYKIKYKDGMLYVDSNFIKNNLLSHVKINKDKKTVHINTRLPEFLTSLYKMNNCSGEYEITRDSYASLKKEGKTIYKNKYKDKILIKLAHGFSDAVVFSSDIDYYTEEGKKKAKVECFYNNILGAILTVDGKESYGKDFYDFKREELKIVNIRKREILDNIDIVKKARYEIGELLDNNKFSIKVSNIGTKCKVIITSIDSNEIFKFLELTKKTVPSTTKSKLELTYVYDKDCDIVETKAYICIYNEKHKVVEKINSKYSKLKNTKTLDNSLINLIKKVHGEEFKNTNAFNIVKFEDKAFEDIIRFKINKLQGDIFGYQLYSLRNLDTTEFKNQNGKIKSIKGIENIINLKTLKLDDNLIKDISPLKALNEIEKLSIKNNHIEDISCINSMMDLQEIDFEGNKIKKVPCVDKLYRLSKVNLSNNQIDDIGNIRSIRNVKKIDLSNNNISSLKQLGDINQGNCRKLEELKLSNNNISSAKYLNVLTNLKFLYLSNNKISDLSDFDGMNLYVLDLSKNGLQDISKLKKMKNLKLLNLRNNNIKDITPLKDITVVSLMLDYNQIKRIDELPISKLELLSISNNQIEYINEDIFTGSGLIGINMNNNKIKSIDFISKLIQLRAIYVDSNPIEQEDLIKYKKKLDKSKEYNMD